MPRCGSQAPLCSVPVRIDFYKGCSHACEYCFTRRKLDDKIGLEAQIQKDEGPKSLRSFIEGNRSGETAWCDWDIPLHVGGLSDPFQPYEAQAKNSLECLKVFAETKYPFIVSTKGDVPALGQEYVDLLAQCNVVFQMSIVSPEYDKLEQGAPPFQRRLEIMKLMSPLVPRTIVRIQPYMITELDNVLNLTLPGAAEAGVHGCVVEAMKFFKNAPKGTIQSGGDNVYKVEILREHFEQIRSACHELGMRFYCGENRLRTMSDDLCCCGIDGLEGFKPNTYDLNHIYAGLNPEPTPAMLKGGSATCFKTLNQTNWCNALLRQDKISFKSVMDEIARSKFGHDVMGIPEDPKKKKRLF